MPSRRRLLQTASAGLAGAGAVTLAASGAETDPSASSAWPMARHDPAGTAHTTESGPKNDVELAWSHDRAAWFQGTTEPSLSGGTLYAAGAGVLALDPETGARRFGAAGPYYSTPARASTSVYTAETLAVTSATGPSGLNSSGGIQLPVVGSVGVERWAAPTPAHQGLFSSPTERPTPVAAGGTVVTATPDRESLVALDGDSGDVRWRATPTDGSASVSFNRPAVRDDVVYATAWPYRASAYDLDTGARRWHRELDEQLLLAPVAT